MQNNISASSLDLVFESLRFSHVYCALLKADGTIIYVSDVLAEQPISLIGKSISLVFDFDIQKDLSNCLDSNTKEFKTFSCRYLNQKFRLSLKVTDFGFTLLAYPEAHLTEKKDSIDDLKALNKKLESQSAFYEYILNNIPSDIAVFSPDHRYLFVNPQGIKDDKIRKFIIGKDDFDYCEFKGLPTTVAEKRRALFDKVMQSKEEIEWEEEIKDAYGNRKVILRKMGPVFDENGKVNFVIGYGMDISSRKLIEEKLSIAKKEIEMINLDLEEIVIEKTQRNLDLAKSISEQEKLVTIGELSSGVAHDLNTPIGAIKIGAESIKYSFENLLKNTISECSQDQIIKACELAESTNRVLYVGGLQQRREIKEFEKYLLDYFPGIESSDINQIASMLVKSNISITDTDLIQSIISSSNPIAFLSLIFNLHTIKSFLTTILSASERAAKVVSDLSAFSKDHRNDEKSVVVLHNNIASVLNIFNFALRKNVEVYFDVDPSLEIIGLEIKLFQLWSNLLKNAIESIEETETKGVLKIYSEERQGAICIYFENNGPYIPEETQKLIFEKFYTTKAKKNGSGLGLSIVKSVLEEHNASISLSSDKEKTVFQLTFTR